MRHLRVLLPGLLALAALVFESGGSAAPPVVLSTIALGRAPTDVAVNAATNRVYTANEDTNDVSVIDGADNTVVATIDPGGQPRDVEVNPNTNRVYASLPTAGIAVIDGASNTVITTLSTGLNSSGVAVNANTNRVYLSRTSPNHDVVVIDGATNGIVDTIPVGGNPFFLAVNPVTNRVYVARCSDNSVSVIDGATNTVIATVTVGSCPEKVGVNPTTNRIYVPNLFSDTVSVIDGASNAVIATVSVGDGPREAAVNPLTNRIYVANQASNNVTVMDGLSDTVIATIGLGPNPRGVAVNPTTNRVYVANWVSDNVVVIAGSGDAQVNDTTADPTTFNSSTTQSEATIAVCGSNVVVGWNDTTGSFGSGYGFSTDGGSTWTDSGAIPTPPGGINEGDPVLAAGGPCGQFYYATLAAVFPAAGQVRSFIGVAKSTDGGANFGTPVDATPGTPVSNTADVVSNTAGNLQDKPWLAVDRTGGIFAGSVYVCWTEFVLPIESRYGERILFSRSVDDGVSFSSPTQLSSAGNFVSGCQVAVGPAGEVYVAWYDDTTSSVSIRRTNDGGSSFGAETTVSSVVSIGTLVSNICSSVVGTLPTRVLNGTVRVFSLPTLAVNPINGQVYVAWHDNRFGDPDILFVRSTNAGTSWSPPVKVNDDDTSSDQFMPAMAMDPHGNVMVIWYDRRFDPTSNLMTDLFSARSLDSGLSFLSNERISDVSFDVPPLNPNFDPGAASCYMGDYSGVAANSSEFHVVWGDNRNLVAGRPDPDIFADSRDTSANFDGDAHPNLSDNCPAVADPSQTDTDGDSLGDACDPDDDNDSVLDSGDNCPLTPNSGQENNVHPGTPEGDHCEDPEPDGVFDIDDNCPDDSNPGQENADDSNEAAAFRFGTGSPPPILPGDLQGDACDDDDDNDGFDDVDEQDIFGVSPGSDEELTPCRTGTVTNPWPPDTFPAVTPDRLVDGQDLVAFLPALFKGFGAPGYIVRLDIFDPGVTIDGQDLVAMLPFLFKECQSP